MMFNNIKRLLLIFLISNTIPLKPTVEYLDTTFGSNGTGITQTAIGTSAKINALAAYSNDNIIAAGNATINGVQNLSVAKYSVDGILDNTFGNNGVVNYLIGSSATANAVALDFNGKIVIVGTAIINSVNNLFIMRLLTNGSPDLNFGTGGIVTKLIGTSTSGNAIAIDANGKILAAGTAVVSGKNNLYVTRYSTNGTIDVFATNGVRTIVANNGYSANAIKIDSSAKIVVAGTHQVNTTNNNFLLVRLTPGGVNDNTFGTNGVVSTAISGATTSVIKSIYFDSSNRIIAGGYSGSSTSNFTVARYNANGNLDTTFGTNLNGIQISNIGSNSQINSVVQSATGKIVASGVSDNQFATARYLVNGSLDTTFGVNGMLINSLDSSQINSSILQLTNSRIVAAGFSNMSGQSQYTLLRYNRNNADYVNVTSITNNSSVNTKIPTISGTSSAANAQVKVYVNNVLFNTVNTNSFGNWDAGTTNILPVGQNKVKVDLIVSSIIVVSQAVYFNVLDNLSEDSLFAYSINPQTSIDINYTALPFSNIVKQGTWSYSNSEFTCNKSGIYLFEYAANAGANGTFNENTLSVDVACCIAIDNIEYNGSESNTAIDFNTNYTRSLTRSFVKELVAGQKISFDLAVKIVGDYTGFNAGLMVSPNAIGTQPCYSLTVTRIG